MWEGIKNCLFNPAFNICLLINNLDFYKIVLILHIKGTYFLYTWKVKLATFFLKS